MTQDAIKLTPKEVREQVGSILKEDRLKGGDTISTGNRIMWAWQHPNWPNFTIDAKAFADQVSGIIHNAERLAGNVEFFDHDTHLDTQVGLMLSEAVATSAIERSQEIAREEIRFVVNKTRFFARYRNDLNPRQHKVVNRMFAMGRKGFDGGMSSKKYRTIAKCPPATAARDLARLVSLGVFTQQGQGRATRYEIAPPVPENPDSLESPNMKTSVLTR